VIGGGIAGCSLLYHLTLEGWTDIVLVERDELTSGTIWHSAAQCPNVAFDQLLISLGTYTIDLYRELAADPAYPINYHTGNQAALTDAGTAQVGSYAVESLRIEKGYGHWKADLLTEFDPYEARLGRFIDLGKDFPGKSGLASKIGKGRSSTGSCWS